MGSSIETLILQERLNAASAKRNDTGTPDSLGDKMVRCSLKLSWKRRKDDITQEDVEEMKQLLALHDSGL